VKRVLVTGASGFLGRHCLSALILRGYDVHAVSRAVSREAAPGLGSGVQWHHVDLLDARATRDLLESVQPSHLLHLAWYTEHGAFWDSPENIRWLEAGLAMARMFCASSVARRFVGAGTCAEYSWRSGVCVESETLLAPASLYGACKHALHTVLATYSAQTRVSCAWGRLFLLYGPHEDRRRLIPSVARALLAGEPARCTHGNFARDMLYVADAADAFVALLDSDAEGAFNIASGRETRLADAITHVANYLGRPELLRLGALPAREEPDTLLADVRRLQTAVPWTPRHSLFDGLDLTCDWWRRQSAQVAE
jgi:nucleoside-diphosphate-sugar epimerase